jgi:hypothetical protein
VPAEISKKQLMAKAMGFTQSIEKMPEARRSSTQRVTMEMIITDYEGQ